MQQDFNSIDMCFQSSKIIDAGSSLENSALQHLLHMFTINSVEKGGLVVNYNICKIPSQMVLWFDNDFG